MKPLDHIKQWHILVVDDDRRLRDLLGRFLRQEGFRVSLAQDAKEARQLFEKLVFDAMILDVMMPGQDGFAFRKSLDRSFIPTLFLTAKTDFEDRIKGLELGGDDYLSKPFEPRELVLRLQNILKRLPDPHQEQSVVYLDFEVDKERKELLNWPSDITFSEAEKLLLVRLILNVGQSVSRFELAQALGIEDKSLDVVVARLRKKTPMLSIETARGIGYKLLNKGETSFE